MDQHSQLEKNESDVELERLQSETEDKEEGPRHYELLTYPADFTLEVLIQKFKKGEIIIPKLQRAYVWNQPQASKLIESFLLGLPVPPIYLYSEQNSEKLLVVDGQQRLRSVAYYFSGHFGEEERERKIVFRLKLQELNKFNGKSIDDLSDQDGIKLKNSVLRAFIMKQVSPADNTSIFHVFERLNTGGTLLTTQEVRNCIFDGKFNELLHKLNLNNAWREIVGKTDADKRYRDIELILRFLALYKNAKTYVKPMKEFLSNFMSERRYGAENSQYQQLFENTTNQIHLQLGPRPFHVRAGLNAAVFDSVYVGFANNLNNIPKDISDRYKRLIMDERFAESTTSATTDVDSVRKRLDIAQNILFG